MCQEPSLLIGGTWRMVMVPKRRLEGQRHPYVIDYLVCQEEGVLLEGTLRTLRVPDRKIGGQGHL